MGNKNRLKYHQRKRCQFKGPAVLINALILIALMQDIEIVIAVRAPFYSRDIHNTHENYQNNYEDDTRLSTEYTMSQNYFPAASNNIASPDDDDDDDDDEQITYNNAAASNSATRFQNLQQYENAGFLPTTMTAAGQHFATIEKGADENTLKLPQNGGIRAMGQYTLPAGKIDYEINAANYDVATDTTNIRANGADENNANIDIIQTNDAYNVAILHDLTQTHATQKLESHSQQKHQKQQQQKHHLHSYHNQHQLAFDTYNVPEVPSNADEIVTFKNYDATDPTPSETKYKQMNVDEQNQQTESYQQQQQQQQQQHKYLHNFETMQYANYQQKPNTYNDLYNPHILVKTKQHEHPHTFMPMQQPLKIHTEYLVNPIHQHLNRNKFPQQQQQQQNKVVPSYASDTLKSQSRHFYTQTPANNNFQPSIQSQLPPITQTVHHTPASTAALAGVPLSRHVETVRSIPIPQHQRELVPYNYTVPIEIPNSIISTIPKPIPINIPVSKTIAVPQLQLLKVPIEKVKPIPVERMIPYLVEKRVPYEVEKQIAKPVYFPYPIKVPLLTTIVHKMPRHHYYQRNSLNPPRQIFYAQYKKHG